MSDLTDRLRLRAAACEVLHYARGAELMREAADALAAKDRRIAELEAQLKTARADAWGEGARTGYRFYAEPLSAVDRRNPHRDEEKTDE